MRKGPYGSARSANPTYCSNFLKERLNLVEPIYMGVPLTEIDTQLPGKASQSPIGVHKDSLDVLTDSLDESHRKKHSVVDKKEEMAGMSLESSKVSSPRAEPDLPVHAKSPVTEAGRLISTSEVYQRDNFLSKMMQYCNGEQRADFPCQYDRDLHMKHKLGYANEKAIHFDMKHHNQALIQPLIGKYLKNMHEIIH